MGTSYTARQRLYTRRSRLKRRVSTLTRCEATLHAPQGLTRAAGTFHGAIAPPHSQRPRRGQTTVTAGLDLRIATTPHTCTTLTGSHGREKANPSMCDLSEVGSILGGSSHRRSRPAVMQMRPLRGHWGTPQGPYTARSALTRCEATLHAAKPH